MFQLGDPVVYRWKKTVACPVVRSGRSFRTSRTDFYSYEQAFFLPSPTNSTTCI